MNTYLANKLSNYQFGGRQAAVTKILKRNETKTKQTFALIENMRKDLISKSNREDFGSRTF